MYRKCPRLTLPILLALTLLMVPATELGATERVTPRIQEIGWSQPLLRLQSLLSELVARWTGDAPQFVTSEGSSLSNGG